MLDENRVDERSRNSAIFEIKNQRYSKSLIKPVLILAPAEKVLWNGLQLKNVVVFNTAD